MIKKILFTIVFLLQAAITMAGSLSGYVTNVKDGDTLTLLTRDGAKIIIRLAEIDSPEKKQEYGLISRNELFMMTYAKHATVEVQNTDRYGRVVGRVSCDGYDVSAEMVRLGAAWVYTFYSRDPALIALENEARSERRGLWAYPDPVAPWEWRRNARK